MIRSSNQYSYLTKRLQLAAVIIAALLFVVAAFKLDAHVDIHMHRGPETEALEKEAEEKQAFEAYLKDNEDTSYLMEYMK
jgi:hypothetical protein